MLLVFLGEAPGFTSVAELVRKAYRQGVRSQIQEPRSRFRITAPNRSRLFGSFSLALNWSFLNFFGGVTRPPTFC